MKKVIITLGVTIMLSFIMMVGAIVSGGIVYVNSDYYYSRLLVSAIKREDITEVEAIINEKATCMDTYPSMSPQILYIITESPGCYYPLNEACFTGNVEIIQMMVEKGADININDGHTPLSNIYCHKLEGWYEVSNFLIEKGAALDYFTEHSNETPAIFHDIVDDNMMNRSNPDYIPDDNEEVFLAFCYALENCEHSSVDWTWVLEGSVVNDRVEVVKLLLDKGYCNANDAYSDMSPLILAAWRSTPEMVKLLLDYGADKSIVYEGKTAYDYALERSGFEEVIPWLK